MLFPSTRLKIFTWHIHGSYLFYLSQGDYDLYIPVNDGKSEGYYGRGETFPFAGNVKEIPFHEVRHCSFDCILFQTRKNYLVDQFEVLSEAQRQLPTIYLEHDPPWGDPVDNDHIMQDEHGILVHVTHFNKLMWKNRCKHIKVIEHGVCMPRVHYRGDLDKGIVVINHLPLRGRKLGHDIYEEVKAEIPIDLAGMGTAEFGGLGEVLHPQLSHFISSYRFFFNPIRYTSMGLAVCEAMMLGMPIVALATTEYVTVIEDGVSGFIHTDVGYLIEKMKLLLENPSRARSIGENARRTAMQRFNISRFVTEWQETFRQAMKNKEKKYENENSIH
jgi:hypothetical protein